MVISIGPNSHVHSIGKMMAPSWVAMTFHYDVILLNDINHNELQ